MYALVVEDDQTVSKLMTTVLKTRGDVQLAENGKEALALITRAIADDRHFDVILLDILMPGMSGLTVLETLRYIERSTGYDGGRQAGVIIMTGLDDSHTVFKAFRQQCDGYLVKPFQIKELTDLAESVSQECLTNRKKPSNTNPESTYSP